MSEQSYEVRSLDVLPCPLCLGGDVRYTDYGIRCRDCQIEMRDYGDSFEDVRERWNALARYSEARKP